MHAKNTMAGYIIKNSDFFPVTRLHCVFDIIDTVM